MKFLCAWARYNYRAMQEGKRKPFLFVEMGNEWVLHEPKKLFEKEDDLRDKFVYPNLEQIFKDYAGVVWKATKVRLEAKEADVIGLKSREKKEADIVALVYTENPKVPYKWVVLELKKGTPNYGAIGQLLTYMAMLYYADEQKIREILENGEWIEDMENPDELSAILASEDVEVEGYLVFPFTGAHGEAKDYMVLATAIEYLNLFGLNVKLLDLKPFEIKDGIKVIGVDVWISVVREKKETGIQWGDPKGAYGFLLIDYMGAIDYKRGSQYLAEIIIDGKHKDILEKLRDHGISGEIFFSHKRPSDPNYNIVFRVRLDLKKIPEPEAREKAKSLKAFAAKNGLDAESKDPTSSGRGEKSSIYVALKDTAVLPFPATMDLSEDDKRKLKALAEKARKFLELLGEWAKKEGILEA